LQVIKFDYPEDREYRDEKLERLIEFKKIIVKYGNWENRKKNYCIASLKKDAIELMKQPLGGI